MLDAKKDRYNFPELKEVALEEYEYWEPDMVLVEGKASGLPLADELMRINIPVVTYSPGRRKRGGGIDKTTRMHMVALSLRQVECGLPTKVLQKKLLKSVRHFPMATTTIFVIAMTMALIRFREGNLVTLEEDEPEVYVPYRRREYY